MEMQEVNITADRPLLSDRNRGDTEDSTIDCTYTVNGNIHSTQLHVSVKGKQRSTHAIVTFHDIGLNSVSNFSTLLNSDVMSQITQHYCVYNINAPGQQEGANPLRPGFVYPSMDNLSDMVPKVFTHFGIKNAICIGCGAGANVFMRFALKNPSLVEGLVLVNPIISTVGNISWIGEKISNFTTPIREQVMNYHFTKAELELDHNDLLENHRKHFKQFMREENVQAFMAEYERRSEINLIRSYDPAQNIKTTLACRTLILVGDLSPFVDEAVEVNSRLDPTKSTFLKMADAGGMVLEEQIFKVGEALTYFLQGLGHIPGVIMSRLARSRTLSGSSGDGDNKRVRTLSGGSTDAQSSHFGRLVFA